MAYRTLSEDGHSRKAPKSRLRPKPPTPPEPEPAPTSKEPPTPAPPQEDDDPCPPTVRYGAGLERALLHFESQARALARLPLEGA